MLAELLVRFFADGDAAAMEALVRGTRGRLLSIARRIGDRQDAEDSVQAAYHALLRHGAFTEPVSVEAWLTTAVVRIAYRKKALARREVRLAERLARDRDTDDPHAAAVRREQTTRVRSAVTRLPATYRDALVLRHLEGFSVAEVARLLDAPEATVKTRTRRGLALLRARVGPRAAWALMVGPWLLLDAMRSTTTLGGVMTAKKATAMAGAALVLTGVGVGIGIKAAPDAPAWRAPGDERRVASAAPRVEVAERDADVAAPAPDRTDPAPAKEPPPLGVSEAAFAAAATAKDAWDFYRSDLNRPGAAARWKEAAASLTAFGAEGFLAVVAHLRSEPDPQGDYYMLVASTWAAGRERPLFDLIQDRDATVAQRKQAILALGAAKIDARVVRDFLVAELERVEDEELIVATARAVGWLKDDRAVPALERLLYRPGKEGEAANLLMALGWMESERARAVVAEFARGDQPGVLLVSAVKVLGWSDKDAAREAATTILREGRGEPLSAGLRHELETAAGR